MSIAHLLATRTEAVITIQKGETVRAAVALLAEHRIGALPVMDGPLVAGVFSERDVVYGLAREGDSLLDGPVAAAMTAPAITVTPDTGLLSALSLMTRRRIRHLPVMEEDRLSGFVSIGDLVKARIEKIQAEAESLRDYIRSA